jgi:hypothetical protein
MDLATLMAAIEAAPARIATLKTEIEARQKEQDSTRFFAQAVRALRESWKDSDPGKYGAHWYALKGDRKAWPRELIDAAAVARHVEAHRARHPSWPDYDIPLAAFAELRRDGCPFCNDQGLVICRYQQVEDGPGGDTWSKVTYLMCATCKGLYQLDAQQSSGRF